MSTETATTEQSSPLCRVCKKSAGVICYPGDHPELAICPDCCESAEHANGETGHEFQYERAERDHECQHCGILRRYTNYEA